MQLITFETARGPRLGALLNSELVLDLAQAAERQGEHAAWLGSMLALIQAGEPALALVRRLLRASEPAQCLELASLRLLAPLPRPEQIRDFANYELHVRQALASSMRLRAHAAPDPEATLTQLQASGMFAIPPVWYERPLYFKCNRFSVVGPDGWLNGHRSLKRWTTSWSWPW